MSPGGFLSSSLDPAHCSVPASRFSRCQARGTKSGHPAAGPEDVCPANQFPRSSPGNTSFLGLKPKRLKWAAKSTRPQTRKGYAHKSTLHGFKRYFPGIIARWRREPWGPASAPTRAARPRHRRDTWPPASTRTPRPPAPSPASLPPRPRRPHGGTGVAHLGWERRTQAGSSLAAALERGNRARGYRVATATQPPPTPEPEPSLGSDLFPAFRGSAKPAHCPTQSSGSIPAGLSTLRREVVFPLVSPLLALERDPDGHSLFPIN